MNQPARFPILAVLLLALPLVPGSHAYEGESCQPTEPDRRVIRPGFVDPWGVDVPGAGITDEDLEDTTTLSDSYEQHYPELEIVTDDCSSYEATPPDLPAGGRVMEPDVDRDGLGDDWEKVWAAYGYVLEATVDTDHDGLLNLDEYRWQTIPVCIPAIYDDCMDYEADPSGQDGDGWQDGAEVQYWDLPNDVTGLPGLAAYDQDRMLDLDGDGLPNVGDRDSDNDNATDGQELDRGTYPELQDSDCAPRVARCTSSGEVSNIQDAREGSPGTGDGIDDHAEFHAWLNLPTMCDRLGPDDGDDIPRMIDPDSDGDTLLDGQEFDAKICPNQVDSDGDGLTDGDHDATPGNEELDALRDSDGDGAINAADTDSDNDGMPDGWEVDNQLRMTVPDGHVDEDGDGLVNLAEYLNGTNPRNIDTESDLVTDGDEVNVHRTDPLFWDSDGDRMPDYFETMYGLDPLTTDPYSDPDEDAYQRDGIYTTFHNYQEYTYGRPTNYDEETMGPWLLGTHPRDADTDNDGAPDGYEVYFGTDPRFTDQVTGGDEDGDGLNLTLEVQYGTDAHNPDTDGDTLCDGGRGANCTRNGQGFMPGEQHYATSAWDGDSDRDGLTDSIEAAIWDPSASGTATDVDADGLPGTIDADSDGDGLKDGAEAAHGADMMLRDSDGDTLTDGVEVNTRRADGTYYGSYTKPNDNDTDDDGLHDGMEVQLRTSPLAQDTDFDQLTDPRELALSTNPVFWDTDKDGLPDGWEVQEGTNPRVHDSDRDVDRDMLSTLQEYNLQTDPGNADTDGDTLPDGYEWNGWTSFNMNPRYAGDAGSDLDGDGLTNLEEYNWFYTDPLGNSYQIAQDSYIRISPRSSDSDGDWLSDGFEAHVSRTSPEDDDTDNDGLFDGEEKALWVERNYDWWNNHDGDAFPNALLDRDSDGDGLTDKEELQSTKTPPNDADADDDDASDHAEVMSPAPSNPNDPDSDQDGRRDFEDPPAQDPVSDPDQDGLTTAQEEHYGTRPEGPGADDSDCDGIKDGHEANYWGNQWNWGSNRLRDPDVDGDNILDGLEIGTVGLGDAGFYHTLPDDPDTDGDGLRDDQEARNNAQVTCNGAAAMQASTLPVPSGPQLDGTPVVLVPLLDIGLDSLFEGLPDLVADPGNHVSVPEPSPDGIAVHGIQGAYGVWLEPLVPGMAMGAAGPGTNGKLTNPEDHDTDDDLLGDGLELQYGADPFVCDTDGDGLGDALEVGLYGPTMDPNQPCTHMDSDPFTRTNPADADSDRDGRRDGDEDGNRNGRPDLLTMTAKGVVYCGQAGSETNGADADSDDDGITDGDEVLGARGLPTLPFCFDSDRDGLSDGLEQAVTTPVPVTTNAGMTMQGTKTDNTVLGALKWNTWQKWEGTTNPATGLPLTTKVDDPDSDDDGIPDGLEDLNHNGRFGDHAAAIGTVELNPNPADNNGDGRPDGADTDGDKILDGRELLVYSPTQGNDLQVDFPDLLNTPGFSFADMVFDAGNPWETDPRSTNTDAALEAGSGETVPDGLDLNPRADAFFAFDFGDFHMKTPPDTGDDKWYVDLYFPSIIVDLPFSNAQYVLGMTEGENVNFHAKEPADLAEVNLVDKLDNHEPQVSPTLVNTGWKVQAISSEGIVRFNLPDSVPSLDLSDTAITLTVKAADVDHGSPNDVIDLDPRTALTDLKHELRLDGELEPGELNPDPDALEFQENGKYLGWGALATHVGINEEGAQIEEDGSLNVKAGDAVPLHFLQGLTNIKTTGLSGLPAGSCQGQAGCI